MKLISKIMISVVATTLILFSLQSAIHSSLPLTDTIYTIPEDDFEVLINEEVHYLDDLFRRDNFGMGFGVFTDLSLWFNFQYLHRGVFRTEDDVLGDSFISLRYYLGDYLGDRLHLGLQVQFRLPTGPNAYGNSHWGHLALGKNEISLGAVSQVDVHDHFFLHFNLRYVLREGKNEDFYGGFNLNPLKGKTYTSLLGLNPFSRESFLSLDRLKNDFFSLSMAANTDIISPFVPYCEVYFSFRPYRGEISTHDIQIEAAAIDPLLLLNLGLRFFFNREIFLGIYSVINPLWSNGFTTVRYGIDFGVEF